MQVPPQSIPSSNLIRSIITVTTTKNAQRKDELDARSKGFQHIIHILSQLK